MNWPICLIQWLHMIAIRTLFSMTVSAQHIFMLDFTNIFFMLDLSLLLHVNVIKIQILVGTVVKVQLSFWNFYCYIVCQIKEGILVWFKLHQHWFNLVTLDENWFDVITKVKHSLEFCEVCSWFRTIQVLFEEELKNYSDCDYCEHGICFLD